MRPGSSRQATFLSAATARPESRWRWTRVDSVCVVLGFIFTHSLAATMGYQRIFWEDELLGWMLLRDPSWQHMLVGWLKGVDGGGILFYITGRLWFAVFGASILSFRMYSATGFAIALAGLWVGARRFYSPATVAFAILITWFTSPVLVQALCEGRFYGLLMASDAAAVLLFLYVADKTKIRRAFYILVFFVHACLVLSHILGIVYSSFIVLAMVALDYMRKRWRPGLYLAAILPDLLLIPCLPAIKASAHVGKPHFWSKQPNLPHFLTDYSGFSTTLGLLMILGVVFLFVRLGKQGLKSRIESAGERKPSVYAYVACIFGLPILLLIEGFFGAPLCTPRYLLPTVVGTMFLIAEITTLATGAAPERVSSGSRLRTASWAVFLTILLLYDFFYLPRNNPLEHDYTAALTSALPKHIPVVCEDAFAFTGLISRQHGSDVPYKFLLDWKNAVAPKAPRVEVTQYHLMENWKNQGYFSGSIVDRDAFLKETPYFYSINFIDISHPAFGRPVEVKRSLDAGNPIHQELARMPAYRVRLEKVVALKEHAVNVWRICRNDVPQCR
jgi:hypothetical protein